jgi:signal transduction histidine kinase
VFYSYRTYTLNNRKIELENIVAEQNQEIRQKNHELEEQNEELSQHNEELLAHRNTISMQNNMLFEAQEQLKEINLSLEQLVQQRTEKLNVTINQLNKTIKELDAFLYSASHDLVSPLKSILGLVNLAKREHPDSEVYSYFDHIEKSVRKLEGVIHSLMQHSFNTKAQLNYQPVDLKGIVMETISELQFIPETSKITFNCQLENAIVPGDAHRLKIVLSNLLGNAIKYHDPMKEQNFIEVKYYDALDYWNLEVFDNGIGIEKGRLSRVFDMFYRATESAKGSGLGLYIVKETIDRLEGHIHIDSELGSWTRFALRFPKHFTSHV